MPNKPEIKELSEVKVCPGCGRVHTTTEFLPLLAGIDSHGYWYNCECDSTIIVHLK